MAAKNTPSKTKAAAKRKSTATVVSRTSNPVYAGNVSARAPQTYAPATMSLPNGTQTVTPIAPPKIDPFLAPTDMAQQAVENGQWDDYLSGLDQQVSQAGVDTTLQTGQIDQGLAKGLDDTDWNSAARGLQVSSVKDQNKAQMASTAAASRGAATDKLNSLKDYVSGQRKQVDTVYKPAIVTKYGALAKKNADDAIAAWHAANPDVVTAAPGEDPAAFAARPSMPNTAGIGGPAAPGAKPTISAGGQQQQGAGTSASDWQPVVKGGKFYHFYPATNRWVYIRPATN